LGVLSRGLVSLPKPSRGDACFLHLGVQFLAAATGSKTARRFQLGITAQRFGRLLKRLPEGHAIQHVLVDDRHERTLQHRLEAKRAAALDRYRALCAKVGRRLSSADLQQKTGDEGRAIYAHIHRTYGGIKAFFAETGL